MSKELRGVVSVDLEQALSKLSYKELYVRYFPTVNQYRGEWRRDPFHVIVESRGRKLVLNIHQDVPTGFGHQAVQSSSELKKELRNILQACKSRH